MSHITPSPDDHDSYDASTNEADNPHSGVDIMTILNRMVKQGMRTSAIDLPHMKMRKNNYKGECEKAYIAAYAEGRADENEMALTAIKSYLSETLRKRFKKVSHPIFGLIQLNRDYDCLCELIIAAFTVKDWQAFKRYAVLFLM
jgi:hypothetical protein